MDNIEDQNQMEKELLKYLSTPKDLTNSSPEEQAGILALHFIGYVARPIGIPEDVYQKCIQAFSSHRGKIEWETDAILEVLKQEKN